MPSVVTAQTDFSSGEIDVTLKRDTAKNPFAHAGGRQMQNWRILNSKGIQNRSGRNAFFLANDRVEEFSIAPGVTYYIAFPAGGLSIIDSTGTTVFNDSARPWDADTSNFVVWAILDKSIYVTAIGMRPRILTWDGAVTWTAADFVEKTIGNQKRTLFYRIAPKGITLTVSGTSGTINITFSAAVLVAGMVGTRIRFNGYQMTIATVTNSTSGTATVNEPFASNVQRITVPGSYSIGQVVSDGGGIHGGGGASGVVTATGAGTIDVTLGSTLKFINGNIILPGGQTITAVADLSPAASVVWDQEVMNNYQGWPQSCFIDQNRLGFCNFPAVPQGIAWSATLAFDDFYPDAFAADGLATDSIFELVPNKGQVLYVVPGMDASEFIFCDNRLYYIPINVNSPLAPGSVQFNTISDDFCGRVQPRRAGEFLVYLNAGVNQMMAVRIFGAYTRAYKTESISELSAHLFTQVKAIAVMTASASFPERYMFVTNVDGSVICGRYGVDADNQVSGNVGWTPWTGNGTVKYVSARGANVLFTTRYAPNGIAAVQIAELLNDDRYLDASQLYNTQPVGLPIPGGKGPLWYLAGGTVDLMDGVGGTRMMGTYNIDGNGFLVPQGNAGEDFTSANLLVGQAWTATLEPFIPPVQEGQDTGQRMWARRLSRVQVYVENSSGFVMQRLYSGQSGPLLPAAGTVMKTRRIEMWNQDEDPTQEPTLREQAYLDRPIGRSHDPRWVLAKDTPGPIAVLELSTEVTV